MKKEREILAHTILSKEDSNVGASLVSTWDIATPSCQLSHSHQALHTHTHTHCVKETRNLNSPQLSHDGIIVYNYIVICCATFHMPNL